MIADATVDCYNEEEQVTGLFTMIQDQLVVPFQTLVLGVGVTVEGVELTTDGQIVAICTRDEFRQTVPILDLPLPTPEGCTNSLLTSRSRIGNENAGARDAQVPRWRRSTRRALESSCNRFSDSASQVVYRPVLEPQAARSYSWSMPPRMSCRRITALAFGSERAIGVRRPIPRWGRAAL